MTDAPLSPADRAKKTAEAYLMAQQALNTYDHNLVWLAAAIESAIAEANEDCAKLIESLAKCKAVRCDIDANGQRSTEEFAKNAAAAIRSRSQS